MRDALSSSHHGDQRRGFTCQCCGFEVVTEVVGVFFNPDVGSQQRFCCPACRQAAYRRRRAGVAENTPAQRHGGRGRSLTGGAKSNRRGGRGRKLTAGAEPGHRGGASSG